MHEQTNRNNRDKHEADRLPLFILSFLCGDTVEFDKNAAGLEGVYLKEDFARRARHSRLVNFGNGCNRRRSLLDHNHVPDLEVLGQRQRNLVTHIRCL